MSLLRSLFAVLLCSVVLLGGCDSMANIAGEWGDNAEHKDDVTAAKPGMTSSDVVIKIGKAHKVEEGENIYAGWQEWIYPSGSLIMYRGRVQQVISKPLTSKQLSVLKGKEKKHNMTLTPLEGDKGESDKEKETDDLNANGIWSFEPSKEAAPISNPAAKGFSGTAEYTQPIK